MSTRHLSPAASSRLPDTVATHSRSAVSGRVVWIDVVRSVGVVGFVLAHVAAFGLYSVPLGGESWYACNAYNALCRMTIPMFVMVSGAMFLPRSSSMWPYVRRILLTLLFWGAVFVILMSSPWLGGDGNYSPRSLLWLLIGKPEHLWFLYMIGGLYLITPILRVIAGNHRVALYYLAIWAVCCIMLPTAALAPGLHDYLPAGLQRISLEGVGLYSGYFILGHLLAGPLGDRYDRLGLPLFLLGTFLTFGLTATDLMLSGEYHGGLNDNYTVNVCLSGVGGFLMFRHWLKHAALPRWVDTAVNVLAVNTMGIYMIHYPLFLILNRHAGGYNLIQTWGWLTVPLFALSVGVATVILTLVIRRIPWLRRLI